MAKTVKFVKTVEGWEAAAKNFPKPDYCANCGCTSLDMHASSVNGVEDVATWLCDECGHAHLQDMSGPKYSDKLTADDQLKMEEGIAATIFESTETDEETCADLGRSILKMVLMRFRADLFEIKGS